MGGYLHGQAHRTLYNVGTYATSHALTITIKNALAHHYHDTILKNIDTHRNDSIFSVVGEKFVCAGVGGGMAYMLTYPVTTIRIHYMAHRHMCMRSIKSVYKGFCSRFGMIVLYRSIYYGVFDSVIHYMQEPTLYPYTSVSSPSLISLPPSPPLPSTPPTPSFFSVLAAAQTSSILAIILTLPIIHTHIHITEQKHVHPHKRTYPRVWHGVRVWRRRIGSHGYGMTHITAGALRGMLSPSMNLVLYFYLVCNRQDDE
ncbi:hypothetical protein EON63_16530 [archaeon]|nr:MAG: hypothetical protein EON63_16530 [archaeon]